MPPGRPGASGSPGPEYGTPTPSWTRQQADGEEEGVDFIRAVEIAVGLLGQYGDKRDLEDGADNLDQNGAHRQDSGRAVKGILFLLIGQC